MELSDIKKLALSDDPIEMNWEMFDDNPDRQREFELIMTRAITFLDDLEYLHKRISSGESVVFEDAPSSLSYPQKEKYLSLIETELYVAYQLQDLFERYNLIQSITELDKNV